MKRLTALGAAAIILVTATPAAAVDPDKPLIVPATVTIVAFDQLDATALALHPQESSGYVMKVNLRVGSRVALVLMVFCSSLAARDLNQDEALALRQQGVILPLEQLLQQAMARYPGSRLLEAELEKKHGQYAYEVELVTTEGVVREIKLDATNGDLIKDEED